MTFSPGPGPDRLDPAPAGRLVVGVDPGLQATGFGLVEAQGGGRLVCRGFGQIAPRPGLSLAERLLVIHQELRRALAGWGPTEMAVEDVFFFRNAKSALALGQVRGVILLAAAEMGWPVFTYNARTVKKSLVGYGQASKEQIGLMVRSILHLAEPTGEHAADALALAVCHLHTRATLERLQGAGAERGRP